MIIVDPVALGDVAFTRASPKWVFNRDGALAQVSADTLAVTYDPADLMRAPYALIERATTNVVTQSGDMTGWAKSQCTVIPDAGLAPDLTPTADAVVSTGVDPYLTYPLGVLPAGAWVFSIFVRGRDAAVGKTTVALAGRADYSSFVVGARAMLSGSWQRVFVSFVADGANPCMARIDAVDLWNGVSPVVGDSALVWGAQVEQGIAPTSYIPTGAVAVTRAADVIGAGAGLVYSNVLITEPNYDVNATYAKAAVVHDPATHNLFESILATNKGRALTDVGAWTPRGATNRWAMLDQYNNTQTSAADEILIVVSPEAISQGLYIGNTYADEVRVSVVDQVEGVVYRETSVLLESNSESSFFNWFFKRIKRRDYFVTLKMPPYANALVTVSLRKIGGTARCGMCAIGPTDEFGPTLMGLSTEGKDYSSTTFNFDGTSNTVVRPYAKKMTCDVLVDNRQIDYLQARLFELRQKPIVWVGGPYGITAVFGRYASFKNVIQYVTYSSMNLTIEGAV